MEIKPIDGILRMINEDKTLNDILRMINEDKMKEMTKIDNNISHDITNCFYSKLNQNDVLVAYVAPFAIQRSISVQCIEKESNTDICFSWKNKPFNDMFNIEESADNVTNFSYETNVSRKILVPGIVDKESASVTFENGLIIFKCKLNQFQKNSFELRCGKK